MKNMKLSLTLPSFILVVTILLSFIPLTAAAEEMPGKLSGLHQIPYTKWAVGDFGYHIDSEGKNTYGPENVVDGLPETAWVTKDDPSYTFKDMMIGFVSLDDATISEFTIRNGYCKSRDIWEKNSRVKKMSAFIDNKPVVTVTLKDTMDEQTFSLGADYNLKADDVISFLILETYPGTKYDDIAISELHLDYDIEESSDEDGTARAYTIKKMFNTGDEIFRTPAVANGVVYIAGWSGVLYAVDISTSKELWRFDSKNGIRVSPCVAEGIVYFGNLDGNLYALDSKSGRELWRFNAEGWIRPVPLRRPYPSVIDGVVYFVAGDPYKSVNDQSINDKLYAVDAKSGKELWRFEGEGWNEFHRCLVNGIIYFGSDKNLHAVDIKTGQEFWRFETGGWVSSSPSVSEGVVYFGSDDDNLYAVDIKTGKELWRFKTRQLGHSSPSVKGGAVYFGDEDGIFYAVDKRTGQELWQFRTKGHRCDSPVVVNDVVYFVSGGTEGSHDDILYALDTNTGKLLWSRPSGSNPPVFINGVIYLAGEHGIGAVDINTHENLWWFSTNFLICTDPVVFDGVVYFGCEDGYLYSVK